MYRYKKLLLMSVLCLAFTGCGNNEASKKEVQENAVESTDDTTIDTTGITEKEQAEESVKENEYAHDAGYTELIHDGFVLYFQELMETIYSRVHYSELGTLVEDITPMDEQVMTQVEEMVRGLNPIQDGEILGIIKETRQLFDETNGIIEEKKYERLINLDDIGQEIYNEYYEWLVEAAAHHDHEH